MTCKKVTRDKQLTPNRWLVLKANFWFEILVSSFLSSPTSFVNKIESLMVLSLARFRLTINLCSKWSKGSFLHPTERKSETTIRPNIRTQRSSWELIINTRGSRTTSIFAYILTSTIKWHRHFVLRDWIGISPCLSCMCEPVLLTMRYNMHGLAYWTSEGSICDSFEEALVRRYP